jgi:GTPase SAR1 family protein
MTELLNNQLVQIAMVISMSISILWAIKYFVILFMEKRKAQNEEGFIMQIVPPKYQLDELKNKQGERFSLQRFIDNLTASVKYSRISFEIFSDHDGIKFLVWTPTKQMQDLVKLNLYSTYKDRVKIKTLENDPVKSFRTELTEINEYKSLKHDVYMLMDVRDFESMDPINDLLTALSGQVKDSQTLFQIVLKPSQIDKEALSMAKQNFRLVRNEITWISLFLNRFESYLIYALPLLPLAVLKLVSALSKSFSNQSNSIDPLAVLPDSDPRKFFVDKDELQNFYSRMDEKYKTSFTSYIRVVAQGDNATQKLDSIEQALESMKSETQNRLIRKRVNKLNDVLTRFIYPEDRLFPFYKELFTSQGRLSSREISMLYHLPNRINDPLIEHFITPDIASKKIYRSKQYIDNLELGMNHSREKQYKVHLPFENRKRHIVVTGQTGTGKSTILKRFILQDIDNLVNRGNKRGIMLMDPHEDFFFDILQRLPNNFEQSKRIIAWDTRSEDYYFGFNPLYAIGLSEREIDLIVDSNFKLIEKVVKRSNPESGMGMTGKPMLINAMKTLMIFQNDWIQSFGTTPEAIQFMSSHAPTLIDVRNLFFSDKMETSVLKVIDLNKYEGLRAFWQDTLPNYKTSQNWQEIRQGFDNKLSQILTGILMYTFGQSRNAIRISNIIRQSKVLLVNLSSKNIGEEGMSLLGSLLMSKVWFEAKKVNQEDRRPFVVYADEFQNFASSDFSQALSEARKFKLELILAHQFFKQLPDDVFHSVMGNVKNKIYYRCGLEDSEIISKELQGKVLEQEVMEVPEFNANVKAGEDVFSIYIPQERETSFSKEHVNNFIDNSYQKYGKHKSEIEQEIRNRRSWIIDGCKFE